MIAFLLKSTISLGILLAVYHLLLEKEKIHQFNRFYLLGSLLISLTIPFITIEIVQEVTTIATNQKLTFEQGTATVVLENSSNYYQLSILALYTAITFLLFVRFIKNLYTLIKKSKTNPTLSLQNATLILVEEPTLPYTFFNKIYINKEDYTERKIEPELFTHELIHVNQKHTLDILVVEVLKTIFWFNPIFRYYKKAIQLNHEFLADEKVVQSHKNVPFYQNLLLSKASANPTYYLASNLNYSVTKKRLIMMTISTSSSKSTFKKLLLIPLLSGIVFLLCTKTVAQESTKTTKKSGLYNTYYSNTTFKIKDEKGKVVAEKKYNELTPAEQNVAPNVFDGLKFPPTKEELEKKLEKGGPETVEIDLYDPKNQKTKKEEGATYNVTELTEKPYYPEGIEAFYKFVGENYKMPVTPNDVNLKGKVYVTFMVEKDGSLSDFKILRDIGYGTGDEAVRVLKLCPNWVPGKVNGEAVKTMYSLPISIQSKV
ncbi:M56 family metallopeptidase [Flavobacterium agrisoli]|uniref:Energy transducer TonB n=1 Tax=Flavobacterium agrisoli TaxID=2793066 RepID=A0A934PQC6_9FLAO|nr:M56 family metallopeptidase [Flavobacterium agrisoli]MBK0370693.1 energy transducer TonB [Flavobacterium agrisoli]